MAWQLQTGSRWKSVAFPVVVEGQFRSADVSKLGCREIPVVGGVAVQGRIAVILLVRW